MTTDWIATAQELDAYLTRYRDLAVNAFAAGLRVEMAPSEYTPATVRAFVARASQVTGAPAPFTTALYRLTLQVRSADERADCEAPVDLLPWEVWEQEDGRAQGNLQRAINLAREQRAEELRTAMGEVALFPVEDTIDTPSRRTHP